MKPEHITRRSVMKRFIAGFLVLLLLFGGAKPANANSAQTYWEGVDQAGVAISDGDCPIIVEHELLTFDLQTLYHPYEEQTDNINKVTAQYTFYNPSDMTVSAKLLFPFGTNPWYGYTYDRETGERIDTDAQRCNILVDGEVVEKKIRYTLYQGDFNVETDLPLVCDDFKEDSFYCPDTTVTLYRFELKNVDTSAFKAAVVCFEIPKGMGNQRFYVPNTIGGRIQDNGNMRVIARVKNSYSLSLYVFGEPLETMPTFRFYQDAGAYDSQQISGYASFSSKRTMTFKDFALENWSEESGISEIDWYNATVTDLNGNTAAEHPFIRQSSHRSGFSNDLMRWYEYEITVKPGARIVNTVTAPIYPSVDANYDPSIYGYTYLLSPATTWKSFGNLDVVVNTPHYMLNCSLDGFEKTEDGYKASFDRLPEGELNFTLSSSEEPERKSSGFNWAWLILLVAPFVLIAEAFEAIGEFFTNLFQNLF